MSKRKKQETFLHAVMASRDMTKAQKAYWIGICRIERYQRKIARRQANKQKRADQRWAAMKQKQKGV